jgi:hypothetical protein
MMLDQVKIAVAAALVLSGFVMFRQNHQGLDLVLIIAGLIYLYIRWQSYKRSRHLARMKK